MSYKDRVLLDSLLGDFILATRHHLSENEVQLLRKAMRLIGRENFRYADLHI